MDYLVNDDPRLGTLIKEGIDGEVVLIGFPYDIGAKRNNQVNGQDNGPDCLRRFIPKAGPIYNAEFDIDISELKITDYGNIVVNTEKSLLTLEEIIEKLSHKIKTTINKGGIPFVIGGTKDQIYGCLKGIKSQENE